MASKNTKILVVDDEKDILEFLSYNLKKEGFDVFTASDGQKGIEKARKIQPDLIILDIMMPEMDGVEVCRQLRADEDFGDTLITFLTARSEDYSQIAGLEVGGDDYITKPIKPRVLVSRVNALLRRRSRSGKSKNEKLEFGDLIVHVNNFEVWKGEKRISMPKKEFELLQLLVSRPGKVFNRSEIFNKVWGNDVIVGPRTIDVHIRKLREKIGKKYIKTVKGIGYKFDY